MPTGCYELKAINAEIILLLGNSDIIILPNVNTLQCILTVVYRIPELVYSVERSIYGVRRHANEQLVNSILVHCNIIHSSYMRGTQASATYNFLPNTAPGQKIIEAPHNLIYLTVTVDVISTLSAGRPLWRRPAPPAPRKYISVGKIV